MNKKLGRLLQPSMGGYLLVMMAFALATVAFQVYTLAVLEILITALVFALYQINRVKRGCPTAALSLQTMPSSK